MNDLKLQKLYNYLKGAFNVKIRLSKNRYADIQSIDIWNYLKINKWSKDKNLSISEMVNDIISVDASKVMDFIKKSSQEKEIKLS